MTVADVQPAPAGGPVDGAAMAQAIARLHADLPSADDPADAAALMALLRVLHRVGRRDLPLGRLFEGHVDAVQIALRYGDAEQRAALAQALREGAVLGVWNAGLDGEPLVLSGDRLDGAKSYASGAGLLSHALVTAATPEGPQLLLLDLACAPPTIDTGWWMTLGMQRSQTHRVRWRGQPVDTRRRIGRPGDYVTEPWFSGGAIRFAAVQAGGVAALFDHARDHLVAAGRAEDATQATRLAELYALAQGAADAVRRAAEAQFADGTPQAARLAHVSAARMAVADAGERALQVAQQAVGLQGLFLAHPLAAAIADLMVYLRQPGPDAQRQRVGRAAAAGQLAPEL